ncbi:MAG: glucose 1-dehydrogenase [SAR324 cluster bacterium]|nr:glucose 1-dehydrogenase [SAR324 cluster bacterium]MCZ6646174.1 glucose 1-dehydrogenase [SAR324 cluster bacterium]MCZ6729770.1 glucose 1-dehydrogenase [SAR324 cluster bacterium]MCZ6842475.1 glucose 1-dehydrogenase [SAR324 cluster bacterium]
MNSLQELFTLQGKTALVTGASGGLGVEFARALAVAGADVAVLARRKERLRKVAREIEQLGVRCLPVTADLTVQDDLERALAEIHEGLGAVDILVNNAGVAPFGKAERQTREQWDSALAVNLTAPFVLCQHVARAMIERGGGGRIINISSVMGEVASSIFPTVGYNASKGAVTNMTRQLAVEWARHGITVNAIAPAWFPTEMNRDPKIGDINPKYKERMEQFTPMGRLGNEGELMAAVIFLASPAASYVTGAILPVDGGWLAW